MTTSDQKGHLAKRVGAPFDPQWSWEERLLQPPNDGLKVMARFSPQDSYCLSKVKVPKAALLPVNSRIPQAPG